jgi:hypothetical protein
MEPEPIRPNPPALLTVDAKRHPLHQTIPPWTMGYSIPNKLQILLSIVFRFLKNQTRIIPFGILVI